MIVLEGGLAVVLAEMAFAGGLGATVAVKEGCLSRAKIQRRKRRRCCYFFQKVIHVSLLKWHPAA